MTGAYILDNLTELCDLSPDTKLCISKESRKLYTVKRMPPESRLTLEKLITVDDPSLSHVLFVKKDEKSNDLLVLCEYASGESLSAILGKRRTLPVEEAFGIALDVCSGLKALHEKGLVHRDVNPNNVVVDRRGHAVLIDFGIVRSFEANKSADTVILGTPGYAAPEQFGFTQSDQRTDIYAVGVLLNVMLTGEFPGENRAKGYAGKIVRKCTSIDAGQRYESIADLEKALGRRETGRTPADRFVKGMPGLRSGKVSVIVLAVILYIAVTAVSLAMFATSPRSFEGYVQTFFSWLFLFLLPFAAFFDPFGIWDKLSFSKGAERRHQRILYFFLGCLSIFIGLIIFGITHAPSSL